MIFDLPKTVEINGREWEIATDYRDILVILSAFEDPDLTNEEKAFVCLHNFYLDFEQLPREQYQAAYNAAMEFIDHGSSNDKPSPVKTMDWEQDAPLLFPAINRAAGFEVRNVEYMHWWTFIGYFMEIKDSTYATVLSLRQKKARHKKLEKYELEYWNQNRSICVIRHKETADEKAAAEAEKARLEAILGG